MRKGFTLIELMVAVTIIALMVGVSTFSMASVRESAKDDKRLADMEAIRSALARYRADCGQFPASLPAGGTAFTGNSSCLNINTYINEFPEDPDGYIYSYNVLPASGPPYTDYILCTSLSEDPNPALDTTNCASCGSRACNVMYTN